MISAPGARSEIELAVVFLFEILDCLSGRNILEPLMLDLSLLNLRLLQLVCLLFLLQEVVILFVIFMNFVAKLVFQSFDVGRIMLLEVLLLAFEVDSEVFVEFFVKFQLLNPTSHYASLIDVQLVAGKEVSIVLVDICFDTIFQSAEDSWLLCLILIVNSNNGCRDNHALLKGSFGFIDKTVEEFLAAELGLIHGSSNSLVFSEVFEWCLQIACNLLCFFKFSLLLQILSIFLVRLQPFLQFVVFRLFDQFNQSLHFFVVLHCSILVAVLEIDS